MRFIIEYQRHGTLQQKFTVPTAEAILIGIPQYGILYRPAAQPIAAQLPFNVIKAFRRSTWQNHVIMCDVLQCDLTTLKGKPLGTIFAKLENYKTPSKQKETT